MNESYWTRVYLICLRLAFCLMNFLGLGEVPENDGTERNSSETEESFRMNTGVFEMQWRVWNWQCSDDNLHWPEAENTGLYPRRIHYWVCYCFPRTRRGLRSQGGPWCCGAGWSDPPDDCPGHSHCCLQISLTFWKGQGERTPLPHLVWMRLCVD